MMGEIERIAAGRTPASGEAEDMVADSGMSAEAVERAEWAWANLPVGPRKWTSLATHEKALVCHVITRLSATDTEAMRLLREARDNWGIKQPSPKNFRFGEDYRDALLDYDAFLARIDALAKGDA